MASKAIKTTVELFAGIGGFRLAAAQNGLQTLLRENTHFVWRRDNLKGKRVVVWCLSVREFTEGQGWRSVPVIR